MSASVGAAAGRSWTSAELAARLGATLLGDPGAAVQSLASIERADSGSLTFVRSRKYANAWAQSSAPVAIITRGLESNLETGPGRALLVVDDADMAMIQILEIVTPPRSAPDEGVHPSAVIHETAHIEAPTRIGPGVVVGPGCVIGAGCVLCANVTLGDGVTIGPGAHLRPGVVIEDRCTIGARATLHSGCVIGADGFGYRPGPSGLVKIPHAGGVTIGDDVEIGANTSIDRGKFGDTRVGDGTKIDNLVQIGHNCDIGRHCVICGGCGLAGSVRIGDGVVLGGGVGVRDNITIGAGAKVGARSGVMTDIPPGEEWAGAPASPRKAAFRSIAATRSLPETLREIQKELRRLGESQEQG
jgi:UDP-3-O-[3-hydroxymyristoyl] glucosamine N-acyltransferase